MVDPDLSARRSNAILGTIFLVLVCFFAVLHLLNYWDDLPCYLFRAEFWLFLSLLLSILGMIGLVFFILPAIRTN